MCFLSYVKSIEIFFFWKFNKYVKSEPWKTRKNRSPGANSNKQLSFEISANRHGLVPNSQYFLNLKNVLLQFLLYPLLPPLRSDVLLCSCTSLSLLPAVSVSLRTCLRALLSTAVRLGTMSSGLLSSSVLPLLYPLLLSLWRMRLLIEYWSGVERTKSPIPPKIGKSHFALSCSFIVATVNSVKASKSQHNKNLRKKNLQQIHTQIKITNVRVLANSKYCAVTISPNRHYIERELLTFNLAWHDNESSSCFWVKTAEMVLSKPIYTALGFYFEQLFNNPIRTKSVTCCVIATAGNYASQCIAGNKVLNHQSLLAYGIFGYRSLQTIDNLLKISLPIDYSLGAASPTTFTHG
jgi:hypothetical protein